MYTGSENLRTQARNVLGASNNWNLTNQNGPLIKNFRANVHVYNARTTNMLEMPSTAPQPVLSDTLHFA